MNIVPCAERQKTCLCAESRQQHARGRLSRVSSLVCAVSRLQLGRRSLAADGLPALLLPQTANSVSSIGSQRARRARAACAVRVGRAYMAACWYRHGRHIGSVASCDDHLLNRSYTMEARWPFEPFHLVMETEPRRCDLYSPRASNFCCNFGHAVEREVQEAIASFISGSDCTRKTGQRPCRAVDLGANNGDVGLEAATAAAAAATDRKLESALAGWFSMMMLQMGAHVLSVEPQSDLARAVLESAAVNCWAHRSTVINARACTSKHLLTRGDHLGCMNPLNVSACSYYGWRWGDMYGDTTLRKSNKHLGAACSAAVGLPDVVEGVSLREILLEHAHGRQWQGTGRFKRGSTRPWREHTTTDAASASPPPAPASSADAPMIDLIKMDADGPEGDWLREIDELMTTGQLRVGSIVVEGSNLDPRLMARYQRVHGFTFYRLDFLDGRRLITPEGWDSLSPRGTYARLDRFAAQHLIDDAYIGKYSVSRVFRTRNGSAPTWKPAGDGVGRLQLEDELLAIRHMRHVYRAKANLSVQAWTTLLNPLQAKGWPPSWAMTRHELLGAPRRMHREISGFPEVLACRRNRSSCSLHAGGSSRAQGHH